MLLSYAVDYSRSASGRQLLPPRWERVLSAQYRVLSRASTQYSVLTVGPELGDGVVGEARVDGAVHVDLGGHVAALDVPALDLAQAGRVHRAVRVHPGRRYPRQQRPVAHRRDARQQLQQRVAALAIAEEGAVVVAHAAQVGDHEPPRRVGPLLGEGRAVEYHRDLVV